MTRDERIVLREMLEGWRIYAVKCRRVADEITRHDAITGRQDGTEGWGSLEGEAVGHNKCADELATFIGWAANGA